MIYFVLSTVNAPNITAQNCDFRFTVVCIWGTKTGGAVIIRVYGASFWLSISWHSQHKKMHLSCDLVLNKAYTRHKQSLYGKDDAFSRQSMWCGYNWGFFLVVSGGWGVWFEMENRGCGYNWGAVISRAFTTPLTRNVQYLEPVSPVPVLLNPC